MGTASSATIARSSAIFVRPETTKQPPQNCADDRSRSLRRFSARGGSPPGENEHRVLASWDAAEQQYRIYHQKLFELLVDISCPELPAAAFTQLLQFPLLGLKDSERGNVNRPSAAVDDLMLHPGNKTRAARRNKNRNFERKRITFHLLIVARA